MLLSRWISLPCILSLAAISALAEEPGASERAVTLVRQLGHDQYDLREQAARELVSIGFPALDALEEGATGLDREVRFRSRRVLTLIREVDFERRLQAFLNDPSGTTGAGLPGWDAYRKLVGDSPDSRSLFIDMQRQEPDLMRYLDDPRGKLVSHLAERVQTLQQAMQVFGHSLSLGSVAALLFAAEQPGVVLENQTANGIYQFCRQDSVRQALQGGAKQAQITELLSQWILKADGWLVPQALMLAHDFELRDGMTLALRSVANPASQSYERQYALAVITRFGDAQHVAAIEPSLQDATLCTAFRVDQDTMKVEVRDLALATILQLHKLDPLKFGFQAYEPRQPGLVQSTINYYFANDRQRQAALEQYQQWKQKQ